MAKGLGRDRQSLPPGFQPACLLPRPWSKKLGRGCVSIPGLCPLKSPGVSWTDAGATRQAYSPLPSGHWSALRSQRVTLLGQGELSHSGDEPGPSQGPREPQNSQAETRRTTGRRPWQSPLAPGVQMHMLWLVARLARGQWEAQARWAHSSFWEQPQPGGTGLEVVLVPLGATPKGLGVSTPPWGPGCG